MDNLQEKALKYHSEPTPGKIEIISSKPTETQEDLSLAYTPGVAVPCLEIQKDPAKSYTYTSRGNTVAVITNGTAVLGLGDIGAEASMPVMEGKCVLFKRFAGINAVPLAVKNYNDIEDLIHIIASLEANFGGINLEDIKAPECFEVEGRLKEMLDIPVFHDDQHGTAIIATAGILNSLEIVGKSVKDVRIVVNGSGAAGIACAKMIVNAGAKKENILMVDSKGVIYKGREEGMNKYKQEFANDTTARTLDDAMKGADVFMGVSVADILTESMVKSMNKDSIIFAMANPNPEVLPAKAKAWGARIVATGRSDFDNQINNVLGFPGIFRGTLNAGAKKITEDMKYAAAMALSNLAKQPIPEDVQKLFEKVYPENSRSGMFSKSNPLCESYIIPKPFDPRVVPAVAEAVRNAARL